MSHFYDKSGKLHECDIKEARKNGWVGSVTEIIHTFENSYGLDLYKAKQMFLASLTLPRPEGINDDEFFELAKEDSRVHSEKAKEFGVKVHYLVTELLKQHEVPKFFISHEHSKAIQIIKWMQQNKDSVIVDFKTQETKDGKFKQPYDSHLFQLCGYYLHFLGHPKVGEFIEYEFNHDNKYGGKIDYAKITFNDFLVDTKLINLYISSNEDIPIKAYEWKPEKIEWGCRSFIKMVELYRILKKL
jgi:hypothetical protein